MAEPVHRSWPRSRRAFLLILVVAAIAAVGRYGYERFRIHRLASSVRDLIAARQFDRAGPLVDRWLSSQPRSAEARFLAARAAIGAGRYEAGLAALEQARKLGHPASAVDRERGLALARLGKLQEAEPLLRGAFLAGTAGGRADPEVDESLARCYLETFQLRAAGEVINRWIQDAPGDARAYFWRAEAERRKGDPDPDALIADYERALRLDPGHDRARLALAGLYLKAHRTTDAEHAFDAYLETHPDDLEAHLGLGQIAAAEGRDDEAVRRLDRARALAPGDYRPLAERGKMELQRGRLAPALEFLDRAVALDVEEPEVHLQRGAILSRLGRTEEAREERAEADRLLKEKEELGDLLKALNRSPGDVALQFAAGRWLWDHGHPEEAATWARKIVAEHPRHPGANRMLADYHEKQGDRGLANFYRVQAGAE